jgi:ankyrin repeat protein
VEQSALYKAVKRGDAIEVRRLISDGRDPQETWGGPGTLLSVAAVRGNTPIMQLLLDAGVKPSSYDVQCAAFGNHANAVRLLLAAGAPVDPEHSRTSLLNALHWSGRSREELKRVRQLLREAGGRELPDWYLRWRWSLRYGWRWRLRRWRYSIGWRSTHSRD